MKTGMRTQWVDVSKYICIICVMITHLESRTALLLDFYGPFFLTLFSFVSGYVYRLPDTFKEHMIKKVKGLFIPWFIFGNFNIALSAIITLKEDNDIWASICGNLLQISGAYAQLWFVAALFMAFIPFYFVVRYMKVKTAIIVSIVLSLLSVLYTMMMNSSLLPWGSSALPWHIEYMFQAMLWIVLGYYFKIYGEKVFDRLNTLRNRCVVGAVYIGLILLPSTSNIFFEMIFPYCKSIVGMVLVIGVCKICKKSRYVNYVGANTLIVFAFHGKVFAVLELIFGKFPVYETILSNVILSSIFAVAVALFVSILLIIPMVIINRYFPWTLGRKKAWPA